MLFVDTLLMTATILALPRALTEGTGVAALGYLGANPFSLLTDAAGQLVPIREDRDATEAERALRVRNASLMGLGGAVVLDWLSRRRRDCRHRWAQGWGPAGRGDRGAHHDRTRNCFSLRRHGIRPQSARRSGTAP
jgi:hypothetical protein